MKAALDDPEMVTMGTMNPIRPAQVAHHFITFGIIYQIENI